METVPAIVDPETERTDLGAMTIDEYTWLRRINRICRWLATEPRDVVRQKCKTILRINDADAEEWIAKAQEYMALSAPQNQEESRRMFRHRMEEIFAMAMEHATGDHVEVTIKPTRMEVATGELDGDGKPVKEYVMAETQKIKKNHFDAAAGNLALKAATEIALIDGVKKNSSIGTIGQMNVQINNKQIDAQSVDEMSNTELARFLGAEVDGEEQESVREPAAEGATDAEGGAAHQTVDA